MYLSYWQASICPCHCRWCRLDTCNVGERCTGWTSILYPPLHLSLLLIVHQFTLYLCLSPPLSLFPSPFSLLSSTLSRQFFPQLVHLPSLSALLLMLCFRQHCRLVSGDVHSPLNRQLRLVSQFIPLVPILNLQNSVQKQAYPTTPPPRPQT